VQFLAEIPCYRELTGNFVFFGCPISQNDPASGGILRPFWQNSRSAEQGISKWITGNSFAPNRELKSDNREFRIRRSAPNGAVGTISGAKRG
jgi:hypothetical protein